VEIYHHAFPPLKENPMTLDDKAIEVCQILDNELQVKTFDPATIMLIVSILTQLVKLYRSWPCKHSPEEAVKAAMNPGVIGKWRMGGVIKAQMQSHGYQGAASYHDIKQAILASGEGMTLPEMKAFYQEVPE
jgi:hypothetical protein